MRTSEIRVLQRLVGGDSTIGRLKEGLDASTRGVRQVAHRVANASNPDAGFQGTLDRAGEAQAEGVDMEKEMVALAEEQIRFEATSQLLQKAYQQIRLGIRES